MGLKIGRFLAIVIFATLPAQAQVIAQHNGADDPLTQGFAVAVGDTVVPGLIDQGVDLIEVGPIVNDPLGMVDAWGIDDRDGQRYRYEVSSFTLPTYWEIEVELRVDVIDDLIAGNAKPADVSILVEYSEGAGGNRYGLYFGADDDGNAIVGLLGDNSTYTLEGEGSSYHNYLLRSNGDLFVDGVLRMTGYTGIDAGSVAQRFNFGDGASATLGRAHWNHVRFEAVSPPCLNGIDDDLDGVTDGDDPECTTVWATEDNFDLDGDSLSDGDELLVTGTDPLLADTDGDGVNDNDELLLSATDPLAAQRFRRQAWVSDVGWLGILAADVVTGDRSFISRSGTVGAGTGFISPWGLDLEPNGDLVVADFSGGTRALYRVDPQTGDRVVITDQEFLTGVEYARDSQGDFFVTDLATDSVWKVEEGVSATIFSGTSQSGPVFGDVRDIDFAPNGDLIVSDLVLDSLTVVDSVTGDRTELSGPNVGSGHPLSNPYSFEFDRWGDLWVVDGASLIKVDPLTGDRTLVSNFETGSGPTPGLWTGITFDLNGWPLIADLNADAILRINPFTGDRSYVSSWNAQVGSGSAFSALRGIILYPGEDQDDDGLPDLYELEHGLSIGNPAAITDDTDFDGLTDRREAEFGSNPREWDTDGDGLNDHAEADTHFTDPTAVDTDGDGLDDRDEVLIYFTDPKAIDTDGDGLLDGFDALYLDPLTPMDGFADEDNDGLDAFQEQLAGSDPNNPDSDGDGVSDGDEVDLLQTDPTNRDSFEEEYWVSSISTDRISRIDPATGNVSTISGSSRGSGPLFSGPYGMVLDSSGLLYVADFSANHVVSVDPQSGDREIVSSSSRGTGNAIPDPVGIRIGSNGALLVTDFGADTLFEIDPISGDRFEVRDPSGPGPNPTNLRDLQEHGGELYVTDIATDSVMQIDRLTRGTIEISGPNVGNGPALATPYAMEFDAAGNLYVLNQTSLMLVDLVTGDRTIVSDASVGSGPAPEFYVGIAFDRLGNAIVTEQESESVIRIDVRNGDRTVISTGLGTVREVIVIPARDADGDGLPDKLEIDLGLNPVVVGDQDLDADGDGLSNGDEYANGTDLLDADTDNDGLTDFDEVVTYGSDPLIRDFDGDGLTDSVEVQLGTDPFLADTDFDGFDDNVDNCPTLSNPVQDDVDLDGRGDLCDNCIDDVNPNQADFDNDLEGDACDFDDGYAPIIGVTKTQWTWQDEQAVLEFSVFRGTLNYLRLTGIYTQFPSNPDANRVCDLVVNSWDDTTIPAVGETFFYLIAGEPGGTIGNDSDGLPRPISNPCP